MTGAESLPGGGTVPSLRVSRENRSPLRQDGHFVLYWMISARRLDSNFALQRAVEWSRSLGRPLVVLEALRIGYPWASDRLHRFALDGMAERSVSDLAIDHEVEPVEYSGGGKAGQARLREFLEEDLERYAEEADDPDADVTSRLSPYLHWGHVSSHQIFRALAQREGWTPEALGSEADGTREGWWGMGESAEAFLDQLVTWREPGFVFNARTRAYDEYESLPDWARETLEEHESDERPHLYSFEEFREARTHDPLWNAAQRQLRREGWIHNYLRMLWGKKILEWSPTPRDALETMIRLNDRWVVDGRDPNSYSGIFWCLAASTADGRSVPSSGRCAPCRPTPPDARCR